MPFITKTDLTDSMYLEDIDTITENDDTKVDRAIGKAIGEAKFYFDRYDTDILFARTDPERDILLVGHCTALAVWWLCKLCPANQGTKDITEGAETARRWLKLVQAAKGTPENWPLKTEPERNTFFHVGGFPKRVNNF